MIPTYWDRVKNAQDGSFKVQKVEVSVDDHQVWEEFKGICVRYIKREEIEDLEF